MNPQQEKKKLGVKKGFNAERIHNKKQNIFNQKMVLGQAIAGGIASESRGRRRDEAWRMGGLGEGSREGNQISGWESWPNCHTGHTTVWNPQKTSTEQPREFPGFFFFFLCDFWRYRLFAFFGLNTFSSLMWNVRKRSGSLLNSPETRKRGATQSEDQKLLSWCLSVMRTIRSSPDRKIDTVK